MVITYYLSKNLELFGKDKWIKNPSNSLDLTYRNENIKEKIKPRIKGRIPKSMEELNNLLRRMEFYSK